MDEKICKQEKYIIFSTIYIQQMHDDMKTSKYSSNTCKDFFYESHKTINDVHKTV